ncbi:carbohydrate ABC transporter permease [Ktedonospora formicarum]|uniref:Sugar ABC transporter permease n=1 Tax=Ktedonospora formicarum TaxID=2778364 RepID=A0A8J3I8W1_9CHLR|nr:sugar ABC transporter permease [Ktedonospora formicarum]GHO46824.1 sugar ABC transporter permease [Ktedonospora formicarum]
MQATTSRRVSNRSKMSARDRSNLIKGLLFILPWIIGFIVLAVYPTIYSIYLSFTRYSGFEPPLWLGLGNYTRLFHDDLFWTSLYNTLFYAIIGVPIGIVIALLLAMAMNRPVREISIYRAILYLPSILPIFALSFVTIVLINPQYGLISYLLSLVGAPQIDYLSDPTSAKMVIIALAQLGAGNAALIFLAGMRGIPKALYEAAHLDGAGPMRSFFSITLPLLSPVLLFNLITGVSQALQVFTQSYIITSGGPNNGTLFYMLYLYNNAFKYAQLGYASALAVVLFIIGLAMALILQFVSRRFVNYDLVS